MERQKEPKGEYSLIEVRHLTKRYGAHEAVSDLSFTIEKGRVYGFLGPNGAGKSTTMNIIAGCLGATSGQVLVDGHDMLEEPVKAKGLIGYLPELPPLYTDMTPREYLDFVAHAKGIPGGQRREKIDAVMEKTGVTEMRDRLIRNLSKGYRQRVGIAQALLGDPEVIILDEPTVGLDPAQIIEIRELIRELGREHTIILSSHILSEVQTVCQHIMIISHGRLVASDTAENLTALLSGTATLRVAARCGEEEMRRVLSGVEGVRQTERADAEDGEHVLRLTPEEGQDVREKVFDAFAAAGVPLTELHVEKASLEDVFLELTQDAPDAEKTASEEKEKEEADEA